MKIISNYYTDVGTSKKTNEDSLCLKVAKTSRGKIAMVVLCDGMGGLSKGELASATAVRTFAIWFDKELPKLIQDFSIDEVQKKWEVLIQALNYEIREYGRENGIHLGTTLTAMLLVENEELLIAHVGDSRVYEIKDELEILTTDQTLVAREVRRGLLTEEQALMDPRRNVLLQCVGECKSVSPEFIRKSVEQNCTYMVCSDGFRHQITPKEIYEALSPQNLENEERIHEKEVYLVELCKRRLERDNISVVVIRTF